MLESTAYAYNTIAALIRHLIWQVRLLGKAVENKDAGLEVQEIMSSRIHQISYITRSQVLCRCEVFFDGSRCS